MTKEKKEYLTNVEQVEKHLGALHERYYHHKVMRTLCDNYGLWRDNKHGEHWWKYREAARFATGMYRPVLPFDNEFVAATLQLFLHTFFHVSLEDPSLVAFTPNASDGARDRQVRAKFGKFLKKYQGVHHSIRDEAIAEFANRYNVAIKPPELLFARTAEEMVTVYRTGPSSCMSHPFKALPAHPVVVYAKPPIAVAYIIVDGRITARALVREDTKEYMRPYGNEFAIGTLFGDAGWKFSNDRGLGGLELNYIPIMRGKDFIGRIVMPYLDAPATYVRVDTEKQTVFVCESSTKKEKEAVFAALSQSGILEVNPQLARRYSFRAPNEEDDDQPFCDHCDEHCDEDDLTSVGGNMICPSCLDNSETFCEAYIDRYVTTWAYCETCRWLEGLNIWVFSDRSHNWIEETFGARWCELDEDFFELDEVVFSRMHNSYIRKDVALPIIRPDGLPDFLHGEADDISTLRYVISDDGVLCAVTSDMEALQDELQADQKAVVARSRNAYDFTVWLAQQYRHNSSERWEQLSRAQFYTVQLSDFETEDGAIFTGRNSDAVLRCIIGQHWPAAVQLELEKAPSGQKPTDLDRPARVRSRR